MQKSYALFDFDGTLISGDSFILFCQYAKKKGFCDQKAFLKSIWAGIRYLLGMVSATQSKQIALSFLKGHDLSALTALCEGFCTEILLPRVRPLGRTELAKHQAAGVEILLITASPSFYFEPLKAALGITEVIGTRVDFDADGKATGLIGENCKGLQKPLRLAEYLAAKGYRLEYDTSYAYGDSASDMPMLELCKHKVGVNAKTKLARKLRLAEDATQVRW